MRAAHSIPILNRERSPTQLAAVATDGADCALAIGRREGDRLTRAGAWATPAKALIPLLLSRSDPRRGCWIFTWDLPALAIHADLWDSMELRGNKCEFLVAVPATTIIQSRHAEACASRKTRREGASAGTRPYSRVLTWIDLSNYTRGDYELIERLGSEAGNAPAPIREGRGGVTLQARAQLYLRAVMSLIRLTRSLGWGGLRYTIASTAMAGYRRSGLPRRTTLAGREVGAIWCHDSPEALEIERGAYYGDEVLVNRRGPCIGPLWKVDVNSLYPWCLADPSQPAGLSVFRDKPSVGEVLEAARTKCAVARVRLRQDKRTYPVRYEGRVAWASGSFETGLCGEELIDAIEDDHVVEVVRAAYYRRADLFSAWVQDTYARRVDSGDNGAAKVLKLALVSIYGRMAQAAIEWLEVNHCFNRDQDCRFPEYCTCNCPSCASIGWQEWGGWSAVTTAACAGPASMGSADCAVAHYRAIAGRIERLSRPTVRVNGREIEEAGRDASIAIAAYCTMRARRHMRYLRRIVGARDWCYQGVDCLVVSARGLKRLSESGQLSERTLGLLKVSGPYREAEILGPKCYRLDSQWSVAGLTCRPHQSPLSGRVTQRRRQLLAAALAEGKPTRVVEEELRLSAYSPRVLASVAADGWVRPWHLVETREPGDDSPTPLLERRRRPSADSVL